MRFRFYTRDPFSSKCQYGHQDGNAASALNTEFQSVWQSNAMQGISIVRYVVL